MTSYKIFQRTTGIYSITCKTTNRRYVGQSKDVASRWKAHLYQLKKGSHHTSSFQEEYNLYGYKDFVFQVELICSKKDLTENEQKIWDSFSNNYNGRPTGQKYPEPTPETRRKLSETRKGRTFSEEHKRNISEAQRNMSAETRRKMSETRKKPVLQYDKDNVFIKEWTSALDASKDTGIHNGSIGSCCLGKLKTAGGYLWKFKEKK